MLKIHKITITPKKYNKLMLKFQIIILQKNDKKSQ